MAEFLPDFPGKLARMLKVTNFRRRKNGWSFFLPMIGCAVLLSAIVLRPEQQIGMSQEPNKPRILRGGGAWTGGNAWKGRHGIREPAAASSGGQLVDTVTRVRDGDTIVVGLIPIRIANLDCAERGSASGDRATRHITRLVKGVQLRCSLEGRRSYDREVGVCRLPDGRDIGEILIAGGYCARWRR
ncbi:hypothetical protein J3456_18945 [Sulfitobacter sp. NFXS29]